MFSICQIESQQNRILELGAVKNMYLPFIQFPIFDQGFQWINAS